MDYPIIADDINGESERFEFLRITHTHFGKLAVAKVRGYELKETASWEDYKKTTWTNGIIDITAETTFFEDGSRINRYKMDRVKKDEGV